MTADRHPNALAALSRSRPTLSALISAHREDAAPLIRALADEIERADLGGRVEIVVLDDDSGDDDLAERAAAALAPLGGRGRLIRLQAPMGRAAARNRLAAAANGAWFLFLDADMRPATKRFLGRWLEVIAQDSPWIAVGGVKAASVLTGAAASSLGAALQPAVTPGGEASAVEPAASLLVHCDMLASEAFDESFLGHGWEDVEWAVRARRHAPILVVEAPAVRSPSTDEAAARERCRSAARNFARLVRRHPQAARSLPSFRAAQLFAATPALIRLRPVLERAARRPGPLAAARVQALAAELWRASWYGEALR